MTEIQQNIDYDTLIEKVNQTYKGDKTVPYMGNNSLPSVKSEFEYDKDRVDVIRRCSQDILFFAEHLFYIIAQGKKQKIGLREYQKRGLRLFQDYNKTIFNTSRQCGKALALDTPIPTPNGWTTMGELNDGDIVYDNYGKETTVIKAWDIMYNRPCYEVTFDNGEKIIADEDHLWLTETFNDRRGRGNKKSKSKKTTRDILDTLLYKNGKSLQSNHAIKLAQPIMGCDNELEIHPYILGLWLGDGYAHESKLCIGYQDIEDQKHILYELGYVEGINYTIHERKSKGHLILSFIGDMPDKNINMRKAIGDLNIYSNKHIPEKYLRSSIEDRKYLLQGLMDSGGCVSNTMNAFSNTNAILIQNLRELLMTLGIKYNSNDIISENYHRGKKGKDIYRINYKSKFEVFRLSRKIEKQRITNIKKGDYTYIRDIKRIESVPVRCITVDSKDAVFRCGKSGVVTSNSTLMTIYALWLITFYEHKHVLIVANKADTAKEILSRIKLAYEELPNWIKPSASSWGKHIVEFGNGSNFRIAATSSDAARGMTISALLLDECAHIDEHMLKEFWSAVKPTVSADPTARVLISSTPNGVGNLFHKLWTKADEESNRDWGTLTVKWDEIPGRTREWADGELSDLGQDTFEQEYECRFLESGGSNIPEDLYNELVSECGQPRIELSQFDGYKIYREPDLENRIYVAGVDIAEGVGKCNSAIQILDVTDMTKIEQVATYANNTVGPNEFARQLNEIMKHWGKPPLAIERNNTGGGVVITLMDKEYNYPCLVNFAHKQGRVDYGHLKGITSSTNTKFYGVHNMFYFLKTHRRVKLRDLDTLTELNTFVKHKNERWGRKSDTYLDDRVDALIWALICVHEAVAVQYFTISIWDDNKKPFGLQPLYEIYGKKDGFRFGTVDNNYGVDSVIIPMGDIDPSMGEMFDAGWLTPEMDRESGFKSYEPSPYQFL